MSKPMADGGIASEVAIAVSSSITTLMAFLGAKKAKETMYPDAAPSRKGSSGVLSIYARMTDVEHRIAQSEYNSNTTKEGIAKIDVALERIHSRIDQVDQRLSRIEGYNSAMSRNKG